MIATGLVTLNSAVLNVTVPSGGLNPGDTYTIISNQSGSPVSGTFNGLPQGGVLTLAGQSYTINYQGGSSGHDVVLTNLGMAGTYYISPSFTGSGLVDNSYTNNQSATIGVNAFPTITQAFNAAEVNGPGTAPGDTFYINGGTYAESPTITDSYVIDLQNGPVYLQGLNDTLGTSSINFGSNLVLGQGSTGASVIYSPFGGSGSLTVAGSNPVTLDGVNSYTGGTFVSAGSTLGLGSVATASLPILSALTVAAGGMFQLDGHDQSLGSLSGTGTIQDASSTSAILTIGANNASTALTPILADGTGGGTLSLVKAGTGSVTIAGQTSTFSGGTTVTGGTVAFSAANSSPLGSGGVTLNSGTLNTSGQSVTVPSVNLAGGTIAGTGGGTLGLTGLTISTNYANTTPVSAAGLTLAFAANGTLLKTSNGTSDLPVIASNINLGGGNVTIALADTPGDGLELSLTGQLTNGGITLNNAANSSGYSDFGTLGIKNATATPSTYSGGLTLTTGRIVAESADALGSSSNPVTIGAQGVLSLATSTATTFANPITITRTTTSGGNYTSDITDLSGNDTLSGNLLLSGGGAILAAAANGVTLTVAGNISETGGSGTFSTGVAFVPSLIVPAATTSSGSIILSGTNTYSGPTTIGTAGSETVVVGSATAIPSSTVLTVNGSGSFALNGYNTSVGSITGTGTLENASATAATLSTGSLNASPSFSGRMIDGSGGGTFALAKTGIGTLTIGYVPTSNGSANSYSGGTTISGGKIVAQGAVVGTGTVTLAGGLLDVVGPSAGLLEGVINNYTANNALDLIDTNPCDFAIARSQLPTRRDQRHATLGQQSNLDL